MSLSTAHHATLTVPPAAGEDTTLAAAPRTRAASGIRRRLPGWTRVFLGGLALWVATVATTFATGNPNLVPTIILLGSFLIPVTFVVYAFGRTDGVLTPQRIFTAFVCGGVLGVLGASVLEAAVLPHASGWGYVGVGLIEEAVKLFALWLLARRLPRYTGRDGMVLGAAVGFGFAALESAGYAFTALFTANGLSLLNVVETEALRGVLAPVGHGLWTAILGAVLFATAARSRRHRPRPSGPLLAWYLVVALLHTMWDAAGSIAVWFTLVLTGTPTQWTLIRLGEVPGVTQAQVHLYTVISWGLLALDGALGVVILLLRWRRANAATPVLAPR
jgi:RsiW-degrading membrane proteinase PrsW (M82 family)